MWTASETTDDDESGDKFGVVDGVLVAKILSFSNLNGLKISHQAYQSTHLTFPSSLVAN